MQTTHDDVKGQIAAQVADYQQQLGATQELIKQAEGRVMLLVGAIKGLQNFAASLDVKSEQTLAEVGIVAEDLGDTKDELQNDAKQD